MQYMYMLTLSVAAEAPQPAIWLKREGKGLWTSAYLNSASIEFEL